MKRLIVLAVLVTLITAQITSSQCNDTCSGFTPNRLQNPNFSRQNVTCPPPPWESFPTGNANPTDFDFTDPNYLNFVAGLNFDPCCNEQQHCYWNCSVTKELCDLEFYNCITRICTRRDNQAERQCRSAANCWAAAYTERDFGCADWETSQNEACTCTNQETGIITPNRILQFSDPSGPIYSQNSVAGPWPNFDNTLGENSGPAYGNTTILTIPPYNTLTCPAPAFFTNVASSASQLSSFLSVLL
eukprot:TRINITY_DN74_c0_g1_i1.p1 TRINITY_DN74_c0_g1~~TRINITY_DN74_c0_g1_i1.p1  ORF type:complete len:245 (+),score=19.76 TRINITY_DN74_c0_g1_i1:51-785(+)